MTILTLPKTMEAAVMESRTRRRGMAVKSFSAVAGSSDVAIVAPAPPPHKAVETNASFFPVRHRARVAISTSTTNSLSFIFLKALVK